MSQQQPVVHQLDGQVLADEESSWEDMATSSLSKDEQTIFVCKELRSLPTKMTPKVSF
jgi:hypothetical protein